ncbi:zinc finger protein 761-like isoform X2 [Bradysia coprophila]|uniref:zinc finger protein 761-like isoform X2 n=1 Tax=Bradysia coprophila TaxID=38358 RepID=UPI00187DCDF9|nr:zinc finger protein 761-like isoform X2 [Bradysia coprophila]
MEENDRSGSNANEDVDGLLKQLRKTFTIQRAEIFDLKNSLRISEAEGTHLRRECHKWKSKCDAITKLCIAHSELLAPLLETNADTSNRLLSEDSFAGSFNTLVDQVLSNPKSVPQNVDDSLRVSNSFKSIANRALTRNDEGNKIDEVKIAGDAETSEIVEVSGRSGDTYDENNGRSETSGQGNDTSCKESEVDIDMGVDNEVVSSKESIHITEKQSDDTNKSNSAGQSSMRLTANVDSTIMIDDSDEEQRKGRKGEKKPAFAGFNEDDLCIQSTSDGTKANAVVGKMKSRNTATRTHTVIRPFKCHLCAVTCSTSSNLKNHVKMHAEEKPFQCSECHKCFFRRPLLNRHFATHSGDKKPFQCNVCEKRFSQKSYLSRHSITHTGGVHSFQCTVCQKRFSEKSFLQKHLRRTHTGEGERLECHLCKSSFQSQRNVNRHTNNRICKIVATALSNSNRKIDTASVDNMERETIGFGMDQPLQGTINLNDYKQKTVLGSAEVGSPTTIKLDKIENSKLKNAKPIDMEVDLKRKRIPADSADFGTM